ncbi:chorismate mutase [uncultured Brevundimonas sp.]|uniref:chorismate mutase n=1 Tax=uncultured Brevundimonas sp. TaxID=213418 RepID=UPI0030EF7F6A|tara:strand:+ start:2349 stop:3125 length:777 start_codon:yes stop_codon:yes gene_type:complete
MPQSALHKIRSETGLIAPLATISPEQMALSALRHEIDHLDDEILALFERRLALASRVGAAKDAPTGPHTKLRPDREQTVQTRMLAAAAPANREAVAGLWREVVGWGLARQGRLQVQVWSPSEPARAFDGARLRFGRAADLRMVRDPEAALAFAAEGAGVAVLAINNDNPWWVGLRREWAGLSVFDGFGGVTPTALAVGKVDPVALPAGRRVVVTGGGDAGDGCSARRWGLHTHHGWTLALTDAVLQPGDAQGCVGAIG